MTDETVALVEVGGLADLRRQFPTAKYEPDPGCKRCGGAGRLIKDRDYPCICIFVAADIREEAVEVLRVVARRELEKGPDHDDKTPTA